MIDKVSMDKATMEELVKLLNEASDAYYNDKEIMSNKEFDDLFDRLKELETKEGRVLPNSPTRNVGSPIVDSLPKFAHTYPAKSLDKTKDVDEFVAKFREGIVASGSSNNKVVLMWKEDGATLQIYYKEGKLDMIVTRGNGEIGSIVTHNLNCISGVPTELPVSIDMVVRGEAVMAYKEFDRINKTLPDGAKYANPRNLAAATLTMLDSNEASKRHLKFQAFDLVHASETSDFSFGESMSADFECLKNWEFNVVPYWTVPVDALEEYMESVSSNVQNYKYPVDGLVAAMDNRLYAKSLPNTEHHPNIMQGYAFKWADETKETILREIEWSPSRTGLLNPVAIFDPVELEGTTVKRASLHNVSIMKKLRIHEGDRITVYKANRIIPIIDENLDYDKHSDDELFEIPVCPTCGTEAIIYKSPDGIETMYCRNDDCPEKLIGKLAHFCSRDCMDIQGMSEERIKKLVDAGFIKEYADIFGLKEKPAISFLPGFGKQSWTKLYEAAEKARKTTFVQFITALGITNIGKGQAKVLFKYINANYDKLAVQYMPDVEEYSPASLFRWMTLKDFDFSQIEGFGKITSNEVITWAHDHWVVDTPETHVFIIVDFVDPDPRTNDDNKSALLDGKSFCITGKLVNFSNRDALVAVIEENGGKFVSSVSSKTDYLINNDTTSTSGKNKKAKELNIPILSEEDFLQMIGG